MSTLEVILLIATTLALFIPFLYRLGKQLPRWLDFAPAALLVLLLVQIVIEGFHMYMIAIYVTVVLLFLQTVRRIFRPSAPLKASRARIVFAYVNLLLGFAILVVGVMAGPMVGAGAPEDLSRESWMTAFDRMNAILVQRYAFSEWKQIDWEAHHSSFAPRIAAAQQANDKDAYHLALREYIFSIPDGHIKFDSEDMSLWRKTVGGGFGLSAIELDDGSLIVHKLLEGGPAEGAGITWGAEILEWGGLPARQAIEKVAPIWWVVSPATQEGRRYVQQVLLTRAPVGAQAILTFQNSGEAEPRTVTLTAIDDGLEPLYNSMGWFDSMMIRGAMGEPLDERAIKQPPEYRILPEGYGYIRVHHVIPDEGDPDFVEIVEQAVTEFVAQDVPGVIIDVRSNPGGHDTLVPAMMGHFLLEPDFYEYMYFENWLTGFRIFDMAIPLPLEPKEPHYGGPLAVLIDQHTRSSGEGYPLIAQRLPQGHVVGIYGTNASFGMCCSSINLPGGFGLMYPGGQSQDVAHKVQLDSDYNLQGGVIPDIRVPLTRDNLYAIFVDGEDLVLRYAIEALQDH
jgi:carboxyl-terminal processing protease